MPPNKCIPLKRKIKMTNIRTKQANKNNEKFENMINTTQWPRRNVFNKMDNNQVHLVFATFLPLLDCGDVYMNVQANLNTL